MASAWIGQKAQERLMRIFVECPKGFGWKIVDMWAYLFNMKLGEHIRLSNENSDVHQLDVRRAGEVVFCTDGAIKRKGELIGKWKIDVEASKRLGGSVRVVSINPDAATYGNLTHV